MLLHGHFQRRALDDQDAEAANRVVAADHVELDRGEDAAEHVDVFLPTLPARGGAQPGHPARPRTPSSVQ